MTMPDVILVLNAGSSSIKLGVFAIATAEPTLLCSGLLDEQDAGHRLTIADTSGRPPFDARPPAADDGSKGLLLDILRWIETYLSGSRLLAVGHRIVHGGRDFFEPVEVTPEVLEALAALTSLAPLHQPVCLSPIRAIAALRPGLPQIACFDTAFHHHLAPPVSRLLLGVSGLSADMRVLSQSGNAAAREAIELFTHRAARDIVAMADTLEGLECLVFTGGIGQHSAEIRQAICARLHWLGVRLDQAANEASAQSIHAEHSEVAILVLPTSEESSIARHCRARLSVRPAVQST
jgi:acetate kinase